VGCSNAVDEQGFAEIQGSMDKDPLLSPFQSKIQIATLSIRKFIRIQTRDELVISSHWKPSVLFCFCFQVKAMRDFRQLEIQQ